MNSEKQIKKQKELDKYKEKLKPMSLDELTKLEQKVIKEAEEVEKKIADRMFDLPTENYPIVAEAIRYFLNKQTVQWQYTLGLVTLYDFWDIDNKPEKINYPTLDSTLRTLGDMQFKGYEEWARVIAINKYFEPLHEAYADATEEVYDVAAKHNMILEEMELKTPVNKLNKQS